MGLFEKLRARLQEASYSVNGDAPFLAAACSAVAMVVYADGTAEDAEKDAAFKGLMNHPVISRSFDSRAIQKAFDTALENSSTRAGKQLNIRAVTGIVSRPKEQREDVFLMACDVGDVEKAAGHQAHGIGDDEYRVLEILAKTLNLTLAEFGVTKAAA